MKRRLLMLSVHAVLYATVVAAQSAPVPPRIVPSGKVVLAPPRIVRPAVPNRDEHLQPPRVSYTKHPLEDMAHIRTEETENFLEARQRLFIGPRAYPRPEIDPRIRARAYEHLLTMRKALGIPHLSTQWRPPSMRFSTVAGPGTGPGGGPSGGPGDHGAGSTPGAVGPNGCAWASIGPTNINGRVTRIAIDPTNHTRIYATSVGGIWRSLDSGRRWNRVSDDFLAATFSSVAVNPGTASEVLAGGGDPNYAFASDTNGLGIWRSNAYGDPGSWAKVSGTTFDNQIVFRIRFDPAAPNDVYVAASNGVWRGVHSAGSITFTRVGGFDASVSDMAIDFSVTPHLIYAGVRDASPTYARGIWKWNGTSWAKKDTGIPSASGHTIALAIAESDPVVLYAKVEAAADGQLLGVYKTVTAGEPPFAGGNPWSALPTASALNDSNGDGFHYSWYNSVIEVDPHDENVVYAAGLNIWRTTNAGADWFNVSSGADPAYTYGVHADQHAIAFDPADSHIVYLGNDGGIDKSTDTSVAPWHWYDSSHGMVMTEFYKLNSTQSTATLTAGGSQDNGTEITFGNRTWYNPGGCDGAWVAVDAQDPDSLYAFCNGGLYEIANAVPATPGGGTNITWSSPSAPVIPPPATDENLSGRALAGGGAECDPKRILKTTDGVNWTSTTGTLPAGGDPTFIAIAPSSSFQTYYVGVRYYGLNADHCPGVVNAPFHASIYRTTNGGGMWNTTPAGLPDQTPMSVAIDPANADRAVATFAGDGGTGGVYMTTNGTDWTQIQGTGATALPAIATSAVTFDPASTNVVYVATDVGVFRGTLSMSGTTPVASWAPFDEGLPDGIVATGIFANRSTGVITVVTMGHGAFQRDVRSGITCPARTLTVRDNVFDRSFTPSPSDIPDPEHPIADASRPNFYKPDDTPAGRVQWWTSDDIRIDVPAVDPPQNQLPAVDHVEFEICPTLAGDCPAGTLLDSHPRRGVAAHAYVQVTNRGLQPLSNVRVIAMWTDATTTVPDLPPDFWTTTFPAGSTACGALSSATGWHVVDTATPCRVIPVVNPDVPEIAAFNWSVPATAPDHTCMMVVTESADDPIASSVRSANERRSWVLVPNNRQIAQRNLHVVDMSAPAGSGDGGSSMMSMNVPNPMQKPGIELLISASGMEGAVRFLLPSEAATARIEGLERQEVTAPPEGLLVFAREQKLDPRFIYTLKSGVSAAVLLPIPGGAVWRLGVIAPPEVRPGTSARLNIVARQDRTILGGNTYLFRMPLRKRRLPLAIAAPH